MGALRLRPTHRTRIVRKLSGIMAAALLLLHAPASLAQDTPLPQPSAPFLVVQPQDSPGPASGAAPGPTGGETSPAAQESPWPDNQRPQTVVLTYSEPLAGGGAAHETLRARLGEMTAELRVEPAPTAEASLTVVITPQVDYEPPSPPYGLGLVVGQAEIRIDAAIASRTRAFLEQEAREVIRALRSWGKWLDGAEQTALLDADGLQVPLVEPFVMLRRWSKPGVELFVRGRGRIQPEITTAELPAGCSGTFDGTWETNFGHVRIQQQGQAFLGSYEWNGPGLVAATVEGDAALGTWEDGSGHGRFTWTLREGGGAFVGEWTRVGGEGSPAGQWTGTCGGVGEEALTATLRVTPLIVEPAQAIEVAFTAPSGFPDTAWVGIIPAGVPHGDEARNDANDVEYAYLEGRTSGTLRFTAPQRPGAYEARMHDGDDGGREVASAVFLVAPAENLVVTALDFQDHRGRLIQGQGAQAPQLAHGEPFFIVLEYETAPAKDEQPVTLRWGGNVRNIVARRADDPHRYEAGLLEIRPPEDGSSRDPDNIVRIAAGTTLTASVLDASSSVVISDPEIHVVVRPDGPWASHVSADSIVTDQNIKVEVHVPRAQARGIGDFLVVRFKTRIKDDDGSLRLRAGSGTRGAVVYTHSGPLSLARGGEGEEGNDLSPLASEKEDTLVVSYGAAQTSVKVYWSWVQLRLAQLRAAFSAVTAVCQRGFGDPDVSRASREKLHQKLRLINNVTALLAREADDYTDYHRLAIADAYFRLLQTDPARWDLRGRGGWNSVLGIVYTSTDEVEALNHAIQAGRQSYRDGYTTLARDLAIGGYQIITDATGAGQALMLFTGRDVTGRRVSLFERVMAGVDLGSRLALTGAIVGYGSRLIREGAPREGPLAYYALEALRGGLFARHAALPSRRLGLGARPEVPTPTARPRPAPVRPAVPETPVTSRPQPHTTAASRPTDPVSTQPPRPATPQRSPEPAPAPQRTETPAPSPRPSEPVPATPETPTSSRAPEPAPTPRASEPTPSRPEMRPSPPASEPTVPAPTPATPHATGAAPPAPVTPPPPRPDTPPVTAARPAPDAPRAPPAPEAPPAPRGAPESAPPRATSPEPPVSPPVVTPRTDGPPPASARVDSPRDVGASPAPTRPVPPAERPEVAAQPPASPPPGPPPPLPELPRPPPAVKVPRPEAPEVPGTPRPTPEVATPSPRPEPPRLPGPLPETVQGRPGPGVTAAHLQGVQRLADETGVPIVIFGSRQTGVRHQTGGPFRPDSDLDLGVIGDGESFRSAMRGRWNEVPDVTHNPMALYPSAKAAEQALGAGNFVIVRPRPRAVSPGTSAAGPPGPLAPLPKPPSPLPEVQAAPLQQANEVLGKLAGTDPRLRSLDVQAARRYIAANAGRPGATPESLMVEAARAQGLRVNPRLLSEAAGIDFARARDLVTGGRRRPEAPRAPDSPSGTIGEPPRAARPSYVRERDQLLHEIIEQHFRGNQNAPALHVTGRAGLDGVRRSGILEQPQGGGASWSRPGTGTLREGNVAIRIKPGHERYVEFVEDPGGRGLTPIHWPSGRPGVGRSTSYVPTERLQYLEPGTVPGQERWVDFPPRTGAPGARVIPRPPAPPAPPARPPRDRPSPGPPSERTEILEPPDLPPARVLDFRNERGEGVRMAVNERLGAGSFSEAYVSANDPTRVVRVTRPPFDAAEALQQANARKLDEYGRRVLEQGVDTQRVRVAQRFEHHRVVDGEGPARRGASIEVVELVEPAKAMLSRQPGGQMTEGQAMAFDQAVRELNRRGHAWLDNKYDNYGFKALPGNDRWEVVILDPGGIVPMKGATPAIRAQRARALQAELNSPSPELAEVWERIRGGSDNVKKFLLDGARQRILDAHGDHIDIHALGLDDVNDIAFNPRGVLDYRNAQDLFRLSPEEAARRFEEFERRAISGQPPTTPPRAPGDRGSFLWPVPRTHGSRAMPRTYGGGALPRAASFPLAA